MLSRKAVGDGMLLKHSHMSATLHVSHLSLSKRRDIGALIQIGTNLNRLG